MTLKYILEFLSYCSPLILLLGILFNYYSIKKNSEIFKIIYIYLVLSLFIDLISRYLTINIGLNNNLFLLPFFGFLELALFSYIYNHLVLHSKSRFLKAFIVLALALVLADIVFINKYNSANFQSYGKVLTNLCIMFFSLLFIWHLIKGTKKFKPELIALNSGILFYFSINLLIWLPANFLVSKESNVVFYFWMINLVVTILFYIFLIYLIWQNGKTHKP